MAETKNKKQPLGESFAVAFAGIGDTFTERNFKIELAFGVLAVVLGAAFGISVYEWLTIVVCIGLVLSLECVNTAIESVVDLASPDIHPLARIAKDSAAGAVLVSSIAAFIIGLIIFCPRILALVGIFG